MMTVDQLFAKLCSKEFQDVQNGDLFYNFFVFPYPANEEYAMRAQIDDFKKKLIEEINDLNIEGMPRVDRLNALVGRYVNLEYRLPGGMKARFLDDQTTYLGNQLESEIVEGLCFGVLANMDFILISTYEKNGENPELILYKKR